MPLDQRARRGRMPASRTRYVLIPNQVGCRLPRIRWPPRDGRLSPALTTGFEPANRRIDSAVP